MVSECISFLLQLYSLMDMFPPHDILIGDSNCRFHGLTLSKRFSPDALHRYHQKCNLNHLLYISIPFWKIIWYICLYRQWFSQRCNVWHNSSLSSLILCCLATVARFKGKDIFFSTGIKKYVGSNNLVVAIIASWL